MSSMLSFRAYDDSVKFLEKNVPARSRSTFINQAVADYIDVIRMEAQIQGRYSKTVTRERLEHQSNTV